jgi:hypothetical protein
VECIQTLDDRRGDNDAREPFVVGYCQTLRKLNVCALIAREMKHVRYQSLGNTVGITEVVDDFWEIADDGHIVRSILLQPDGSVLKYDREHDADHLGVLPEGVITEEMLEDCSVGTVTLISQAEFETKWLLKAKNEPTA